MRTAAALLLVLVSVALPQEGTTGPRRGWTRVGVPTESSFRKLFFLNGLTGWALGEGGVVLGTTDAGRTWRLLRSEDEATPALRKGEFEHLYFRDGESGWIGSCTEPCAMGGPMLTQAWKTINGGRTWNALAMPLQGVDRKLEEETAFETSEAECWERTHWGYVLVEKKGAATSGPASRHPGILACKELLADPYFLDVAFGSDLIGCLVGADKSGGVLLRTLDGGKSWAREGLEIFKGLRPTRVAMSGPQNILVAAGPRILASGDGGATWREEWRGEVGQDVTELRFIGPGAAVAAGRGGLLLRCSR